MIYVIINSRGFNWWKNWKKTHDALNKLIDLMDADEPDETQRITSDQEIYERENFCKIVQEKDIKREIRKIRKFGVYKSMRDIKKRGYYTKHPYFVFDYDQIQYLEMSGHFISFDMDDIMDYCKNDVHKLKRELKLERILNENS